MRSVSVDRLCCAIEGSLILRDVSFKVAPGSMTAIVGPNGAGKTTLLRTLAGLLPAASGQAHIDGYPVANITTRSRARMLAFVGQEESVPDGLSVHQAVSLGRLPHQSVWRRPSSEDRRAVDEAIAAVGLSELADEECSRLSGGQKKRIFLARGLAQDTGLILMDEPTNHLDVEHQLRLLELMRTSGSTIIATVHDLDLAMSTFDQIVVVNDGAVQRCGRPEDVLDAGLTRSVFGVDAVTIREATKNVHLVIDGLAEEASIRVDGSELST